MRVKNIVVTCDKELFIELLIKELINNSVSYVQIDNEFHFEDKIFRIFDKREYQKAVAAKLATEVVSLIDKEKTVYPDLENAVFVLDKEAQVNDENLSIEKPKVNKKYIKEQNRMYNQQLKNNFKNKRK